MKKRAIILLGGPGAGKGTQAARLADALSLPHVSTGDLFRENLSKQTGLGRQAKGYMNAGQLVPDDLVLEMLFDRVGRADCRDGYLLDGFPRTVPQAEAFDARCGDEVDLEVAELVVSDETIVRRISGRLSCRSCGRVHHREFSPPQREGVCDSCGGELVQREDDRPEAVTERLRVYHEQTRPLVGYYEERGVLQRIDGERSPDEVFRSLETAVGRTADSSSGRGKEA